MTEYALYLESGPRQRKTRVHVLELLGCFAQGPTTEAALEATSEAVRSYQRCLHGHGEGVDLSAPFSTKVVEHVMKGVWLGYGDPTPGFSFDFQALSADELEDYIHRLTWIQADLLELIQGAEGGRVRRLFHPEKLPHRGPDRENGALMTTAGG